MPAANRRFSLSSAVFRPRANCHFSSTRKPVHQVLKELTVLPSDLSHRSNTATIDLVVLAKPPSNPVSTKVMPRQPRTLIEINPRRIKPNSPGLLNQNVRDDGEVIDFSDDQGNRRIMARSGAMFRLKDTTGSGAAKPLIWIKPTPSLPPTLRHRFDLQAKGKLRSRKRDCLAV